MAIFRFTVTRDVTQSKVCEIEAATIDEAHELACTQVFVATSGWEDDELPSRCEPYVSDCTEYEILDGEVSRNRCAAMTGNGIRCERANIALNAYTHTAIDNTPEDGVVDLLTDLRHWCENRSLNFDDAVELSQLHFQEEVACDAA